MAILWANPSVELLIIQIYEISFIYIFHIYADRVLSI